MARSKGWSQKFRSVAKRYSGVLRAMAKAPTRRTSAKMAPPLVRLGFEVLAAQGWHSEVAYADLAEARIRAAEIEAQEPGVRTLINDEGAGQRLRYTIYKRGGLT